MLLHLDDLFLLLFLFLLLLRFNVCLVGEYSADEAVNAGVVPEPLLTALIPAEDLLVS